MDPAETVEPPVPVPPAELVAATYRQPAYGQPVPLRDDGQMVGGGSGAPWWLKTLLSLAAVAVLGYIGVASYNALTVGRADAVGRAFIKDLQRNDAAAAYDLTAGGFRQVTSQSQLRSIALDNSDVLRGEVAIDGSALGKDLDGTVVKIVVYRIHNVYGVRYIRLALAKTGSSWKIVNVRFSLDKLSPTVLF